MKLSSSSGTVTIDDRHGARITSLVMAGREWLTSSSPMHDHRRVFVREGLGGWDEACPTVAPCRVGGVDFGDHGALWSRPWRVTPHAGDRATWLGEAPEIPLSLSRTMTLTDNALLLEYELTVRAEHPLPILWSAHPLFRAGPSSRFVVAGQPVAVEEWPVRGRRLSDPGRPLVTMSPDSACKGFLLTADDVALEHGDGARLSMAFTGAISTVGLWWDRSLFGSEDTMAIEPTLAPTDRADAGTVSKMGGGATLEWGIRLTAMPGR